MKNILGQLKKQFKRSIIKSTFIETASDCKSKKSNVVFPETIATPEASQMFFIDEAKSLQGATHSTPCAYTTILEDVFYCPQYSIILTNDKKIILDSFNVLKPLEDFKLDYLFTSNIQEVPGYSMIWHQVTNNYYHTLIDNLPRFYLTSLHDIIQQNDVEIKLIHTRNIFDMEMFYLKKFMKPNIKVNPIHNHQDFLNKPKLFHLEKIVISTFLNHNFSGFLPSQYRKDIFDKFLPQKPRVNKKKIFISRKEAYNKRNIVNEAELLEVLYKFGFEKYTLEKMPLTEQIELFYNAEAVVSAHGAGLTNMVFSENLKVLELFPYPFIIPYFYYLAKSMGHTYQYWCSDCQYNTTQGWNSNFIVDIPQVQKILEHLF